MIKKDLRIKGEYSNVNRRSDAVDVQEILVSVEKRQIQQNYRMN